MKLWDKLRSLIREIADITDSIDTDDAAVRIKNNIWFRGPNVWILAFSIVIASVGLNINSTAVIIGAMLVSPLMGPIIGVGYSLGTNNTTLLREAFRNLLVMVAISLLASSLFFLLSPLHPVNHTELEARTGPTFYDVLIALFGGLAGILETCRKERGTVLSGVAIATALMPPLCTAGYGLANLDMHYFLGAMYLFTINGVFIALATYGAVKILHFKEKEFMNKSQAKRQRTLITVLTLAVLIPSIWSAFRLVRQNNFEHKVIEFINENKTVGRSYIYDFKIHEGKKAEIFLTGEPLSETERVELLLSASKLGIPEESLTINDRTSLPANDEYEKMVRGIYDRTDEELARKDARILQLEEQLDAIRAAELPYGQLAREIRFRYPDVREVTLSRGAQVAADTLGAEARILVIAGSDKPLPEADIKEMNDWLKVRLNDTTVVVMNIR